MRTNDLIMLIAASGLIVGCVSATVATPESATSDPPVEAAAAEVPEKVELAPPPPIDWDGVQVETWENHMARIEINPAEVHHKWFRHPVRIIGTLSVIQITSAQQYRLYVGPKPKSHAFDAVSCTVESPNGVTKLRTGQKVTVRGIGGEWALSGYKQLDACELEQRD